MNSTVSARTHERGQGFTEFALVLPILLVLIFAIIDMSRVLVTYAMTSNNLRDALRQAEVLGYDADDFANIPYRDCAAMVSRLRQVFFIYVPDDAYTITYFDHTTYDANYPPDHIENDDAEIGTCGPGDDVFDADITANNELENGDFLEITVTTDVGLLTPGLTNFIPAFPINFDGKRTILVDIPLQLETCEDITVDFANHVPTDAEGDPYYENYFCDSDADGLNDFWEDWWFGDRDARIEADNGELEQTGTDDAESPSGDGCNNGCEETRNSDPLDSDTDNDTLTDGEEAYTYFTDPTLVDTDADGITDPNEINGVANACDGEIHETSPRKPDTDGDRGDPLLVPTGLTDLEEINGIVVDGVLYCPDPNDTDSDDDTINDYDEYATHGTDPTSDDTDGDTLTDYDEIFVTTTDPTLEDTDDDGVNDNVEVNDPDDPGDDTSDPFDPCDPNPDAPPCDADDDGTTVGGGDSADNDPCVPNASAAPCDNDGDGETVGEGDPDDNNACDPNLTAPSCDYDGDGETVGEGDPDDNDLCNPIPCASDVDGDLTPDDSDPAPTDPCNPNPNANPCDADGDGTTVGGGDPAPTDPCNPNPNASPCDFDADGETVGEGDPDDNDPCNPDTASCDTDGDGLLFGDEQAAGTSHTDPDSDDDDTLDGADGTLGSTGMNPCLPSPTANPCDREPDGLTNAQEVTAGSNPTVADTDNDGLNDGAEWTWKTTYACLSLTDDDSDNDGWKDGPEITTYNMNPCVVSSPSDISINDVSVTEGDSGTLNMTFTVTVSPANVSALTINYATSNGSAVAGQDYNAASGVLNIPANDGSEPITVQIRGDLLDELSESFTLTLSGASVGTITDGTATGTITDNDPTPTLSVADVAVAENAGIATVTITLSAASGQNVSVNYATANGTAIAGTNYTATSGSRTINAGSLTATFNVTIQDNITVGDKTFFVNLTSPVNATISDAQAVVTITDDDNVDSDNDGLINNAETDTYLTLPNDRDTDNDLLTDGEEVLTYGTSPTTAGSQITAKAAPAVETFLTSYINSNDAATGAATATAQGFTVIGTNVRIRINLTTHSGGIPNQVEDVVESMNGTILSSHQACIVALMPIDKITALLMHTGTVNMQSVTQSGDNGIINGSTC